MSTSNSCHHRRSCGLEVRGQKTPWRSSGNVGGTICTHESSPHFPLQAPSETIHSRGDVAIVVTHACSLIFDSEQPQKTAVRRSWMGDLTGMNAYIPHLPQENHSSEVPPAVSVKVNRITRLRRRLKVDVLQSATKMFRQAMPSKYKARPCQM